MKKERYKKEEKVTQEIKQAMFGEKTAPMYSVIQQTPELDELFLIRKQVSDSIKNNQPIPKFKNLYNLTSSINLMRISHKKLAKNQGAGTPGSEKESIENISENKLIELSNQLKNNTFKWKYIKKIEIPRSGKKPRPLGIPNYTEKIVQNNILMIMESIYEPIFEKYNYNYGFRPHKGCMDAIESIIQYNNQGLNWAIEGDIKGAFDNIRPSKLATILTEYIEDKQFINLIYKSCITPTIKNQIVENSEIGTPQGSIISPILFNIYMHKFDLDLINMLEELKTEKPPINPILDPVTKNYGKLRWKINKLKQANNKLNNRKNFEKLSKLELTKISKINKKIYKLKKFRSRIIRYDYERIPIRFFYNRYADDFIILINRSRQLCEHIKNKIAQILSDKYFLELNLEKTKITQLKTNHVNYLGYSLFMQKREMIKQTDNNELRRSERQILVGPDISRIYKRLVDNQFAEPNTLKPISKAPWTVLTEQHIIEKYNSMMYGLFNYYYPIITYKSELNRIYFILYYSCLKTLARKHKISVKQLFERNGWTELNTKHQNTNRKRIVFSYFTTNIDNIKTYKFAIVANYRDIITLGKNTENNRQNLKKQKYENKTYHTPNTPNYSLQSIIEIQSNKKKYSTFEIPLEQQIIFEDIWKKYKTNWRTKFKITKFCNICGSNENLQTHHIKKISGPTINPKDTFTQTIMKNLNRKQLVVCKLCHMNIHAGKYSGISLKDLYDIRTIQIENHLKSYTTIYYDELDLKIRPKNKEKYTFIPTLKIVINNNEQSQTIGTPNKYTSIN